AKGGAGPLDGVASLSSLSATANDLWYPAAPTNATAPEAANVAVVEPAIYPWASAQKTLSLSGSLTDSLASGTRSPADSPPSTSLWDEPFIAPDVLFQASGSDGR